nr:MAG TPA: hypothetical protein [Caudoviricetes sp.]
MSSLFVIILCFFSLKRTLFSQTTFSIRFNNMNLKITK